jgi:hypothetical protein
MIRITPEMGQREDFNRAVERALENYSEGQHVLHGIHQCCVCGDSYCWDDYNPRSHIAKAFPWGPVCGSCYSSISDSVLTTDHELTQIKYHLLDVNHEFGVLIHRMWRYLIERGVQRRLQEKGISELNGVSV